MPLGDGTGPAGMGPMTGRAMGYCAGYPVPGFMNPGFGPGWGWRYPVPYGYRRWPFFGVPRLGWGLGFGLRRAWGRGARGGWGRGWRW